jgi:hypothetical protein
MRLDAEHSGILSRMALEEAKREMPAHLYDQEMRCSRVTAEERALISSLLLESLSQVTIPELETKKIISCDPSEGNDEIPIMVFENSEVVDMEILHQPDIKENVIVIAHHLESKSLEHKCKNFIIDSIGVGSGVSGALRLKPEFNVQVFKGNENADEEERFYDKNMEATYYTARQMRMGNIARVMDSETRRQLPVASRFQVNSKGQLRLDNSKVIREILKQSPDRAKTYLMGQYGLQYVRPDGEDVTDRMGYKRSTKKPKSPMVMG